jgi:hypothetical protein
MWIRNTERWERPRNAWNRRLPGLVCPLKLSDGELYLRTLGEGSDKDWQQKTGVRLQARWRAVQKDATGKEPGTLEDMPTVPTVRFLGVVNGTHRCKPDSEPSLKRQVRETQPPPAAAKRGIRGQPLFCPTRPATEESLCRPGWRQHLDEFDLVRAGHRPLVRRCIGR